MEDLLSLLMQEAKISQRIDKIIHILLKQEVWLPHLMIILLKQEVWEVRQIIELQKLEVSVMLMNQEEVTIFHMMLEVKIDLLEDNNQITISAQRCLMEEFSHLLPQEVEAMEEL